MNDCDIFREDLANKYLNHGYALWQPDPGTLYEAVEVGDVGYIRDGKFHRLFNVFLSEDHPSHRNYGVPEYHEVLQLNMGEHIDKGRDNRKNFCSKHVTLVSHGHEYNALGPDDDAQVTFSCLAKRGALLFLPFSAQREDTVARGEFGRWIVKNINIWFAYAKNLGLGINGIEDIILVTGRHRARSWVYATFNESPPDAQVSFGVRVSGNSGVHLEWRDVRGGELKLGPSGENLRENQCIFVRGFRVVRVVNLWPRLRGLAGPSPGTEGGNEPESDKHLELIGIPAGTNYQDPLQTLLDYIVEHSPDCDMALVHDDSLARLNGSPGALTEHLQHVYPKVQQVLLDVCPYNESGSRTAVDTAKVAMLSQDAFEIMHSRGSPPAHVGDKGAMPPDQGIGGGSSPGTELEHIIPSSAPELPHSPTRTLFTPSDVDTGRDIPQRHSQSHSRPSSPFKSSYRSSISPDRSHTQSSSRRDSIDVSEGTNSPMHTARDPKNKTTLAGHSSPSHTHTEVTGINSQPAPRGSSSPSLPRGTKRKLSSSDRNMPTPGDDDIDSQLIGPGVPSSINMSLEGPALKRRGSIAGTQRVSQSKIFDRRHSIDARPTSGGPQWWSSDRRDSSSSMFPSPPVSYSSPAYSADSSHGHPHPHGAAPFAWHSMQSTVQSKGGGSSSGRPFDPPLAMVPPAPFNAERRMSVPINLPSTISTNPTTSRVLRSRSRPPSAGCPRTVETADTDSAASHTSTESEVGGPASASSSAIPLSSTMKASGMTPYSRSPELRVSHKLVERKRRKEMKELFDELRDQLPEDRGMKASKWEILSKAIDFIATLKQNHQDMTREIDMLRHEVENIRSGVPPFASGGPHPSIYGPDPPGVVPYPPHPPPASGKTSFTSES